MEEFAIFKRYLMRRRWLLLRRSFCFSLPNFMRFRLQGHWFLLVPCVMILSTHESLGMPWWSILHYFFMKSWLSIYHAPNPTIKIDTWQPPHAYKVSTLQVCKAFLATKIYPQKLKSVSPKYLNNFFMNRFPII